MQGLVGCYDFLDLGGQVAKDGIGRYGDGAFVNSPKIANKQGGHVLDLTAASTQYVSIPYNSRYLLSAPANSSTALMSMSCRFRMNSLRNYNAIVTSQASNSASALWDCYCDSSGALNFGVFGSIASIATLAANVWYHMVMSIAYNHVGTSTDVNVWLNGVLVRNVSSGGNMAPSTNPIRIGTRADTVTLMDGQFDFVRIWDRALSLHEAREEWQNPWGIYRRPPGHAFVSGSTAYAEIFTLANQLDSTFVATQGYPSTLQMNVALDSSFVGLLRILEAVHLDAQVDSTIVGSKGQAAALQADVILDALADSIKGNSDSLSLGVILEATYAAAYSANPAFALGITADLSYTTLQRAVAALALDLAGDFLYSGAQTFDQNIGFAIQVAKLAAVSQNRTQALNLDTAVTCEPRGGFLYSDSFDLGSTVDVVDPLLVGFLYAEAITAGVILESTQAFGSTNYAGLMTLAISASLAAAPQFAATGLMTLAIGAGFTQLTKVAGQNTLALAVSVELATAGGFLFLEALSLATTHEVSLAAGLRAVATVSLAIAAGVDLRPLTNFQDSLAIITHLEAAFRSNAALNAALTLGVDVEADPAGSKGGLVIMDAIQMALGIAMAFEKINRGPGGFTGWEPGIPGIFRPDSDEEDVPGIFKDPGVPGVPGIFRPSEG